MSPAAKLKASEIITQLNAMKIGDQGNNFILNRLKGEARACMQADPTWAYNALGVISCIEGDMDAMHEAHQTAIKLSGNNTDLIENYSISLGRRGFAQDSYEYIKNAYGDGSTKKSLILALAYRAACLGRVSESHAALMRLPQADRDENEYGRALLGFLPSAVKLVEQRGVMDNELSMAFGAVGKLLHSFHIYGYSFSLSVVDDSAPFIFYKITCPYDTVDFLDLDFELQKELARLELRDEVMDIIEIDFIVNAQASAVQPVVPLSVDKMILIESLVAEVEI